MFLLPMYLHGEVEFPATGLWNLLAANGGVDHSPYQELNAMAVTADAYTQLVFLRQPLQKVGQRSPTVCIDGAACCSVDAAL